MDGEWEAPQIPNPKCETAPGCGHWVRPMKNNPNYKGKWKAPMIDNPNYQVIAILYVIVTRYRVQQSMQVKVVYLSRLFLQYICIFRMSLNTLTKHFELFCI